jgi:hypothetical protein
MASVSELTYIYSALMLHNEVTIMEDKIIKVSGVNV